MTPFSVFFDRADPKSFENERLNPYLPSIWFARYGIKIGDQAETNPYIGGKSLFLDPITSCAAQLAYRSKIRYKWGGKHA